jgi:hypothetical protein
VFSYGDLHIITVPELSVNDRFRARRNSKFGKIPGSAHRKSPACSVAHLHGVCDAKTERLLVKRAVTLSKESAVLEVSKSIRFRG